MRCNRMFTSGTSGTSGAVGDARRAGGARGEGSGVEVRGVGSGAAGVALLKLLLETFAI